LRELSLNNTLFDKVHLIDVESNDFGQRLDKLLSNRFLDLSRSRVKSLIANGFASINGIIVVDPNFRVKQGEKIYLSIPKPLPSKPQPQKIPLKIIFEDEHLVVINKPAGLVVHPAPGNPDQTLVNALLAHCQGALSGIGGVKRPGIVHRLDKDTSGIMVAAKTELAHHGLAQQFFTHSIDRKYDAIVWGNPSPPSGTISNKIGRSPNNRKKIAVLKTGGKLATTFYKCNTTFGNIATYVTCTLSTGRTHQIRVHMAHQGHGLLGDPLYKRGTKNNLPEDVARQVNNLNRQALHASNLGFHHPHTQKKLMFTVEPPSDFQKLFQILERYTDK
jgi:23S rRNA pseudouridine1911/1915/1917 synthase